MRKLSAIIVDDDRLVLQNLKKIVNWDKLGFYIEATAPNGIQALQYIEKHHPQILITDIIMPVMNGLELISCVRKRFPDIKILIISSYDEFEYAKTAIEKGVTDYILKTEITSATFSNKLSSLYEQYTSQYQITSAMLSQDYFHFLENGPKPAALENSKAYPVLSKMFHKQYHFFALTQTIGLGRSMQDTLNAWKESSRIIYNSLQFIDEFCDAPVLFTYRHFCIIGLSIESSLENRLLTIKALCRKLLLNLNSRIPHDCILYYSCTQLIPNDLLKFFQKYNDILDFYSSFRTAASMSFSDIESTIYYKMERDFPFQRLSFNYEHLENDIFMIKDYLTECYSKKDYLAISRFYHNYCTHLEIISNNKISLNEQYFFTTLEFLIKWCFNIYEQCVKQLETHHTLNLGPYVVQAIEYIQQQYSNHSITAEDISSHVALSTGRLGVLFKQETGKTINEYLTDVRIKNAIYLLSHTSMKIYEISDKCGYKSSQYFSQIFFQKTGERPIEYRKIHH